MENNNLEVVNFTANWCSGCQMLKPILTMVNDIYEDDTSVSFRTVDVEAESDYAKSLNIKSIPVVLFFKNGEVIDRINGTTSKKVLMDKIDSYSLGE